MPYVCWMVSRSLRQSFVDALIAIVFFFFCSHFFLLFAPGEQIEIYEWSSNDVSYEIDIHRLAMLPACQFKHTFKVERFKSTRLAADGLLVCATYNWLISSRIASASFWGWSSNRGPYMYVPLVTLTHSSGYLIISSAEPYQNQQRWFDTGHNHRRTSLCRMQYYQVLQLVNVPSFPSSSLSTKRFCGIFQIRLGGARENTVLLRIPTHSVG
jgi:hypothetical protein